MSEKRALILVVSGTALFAALGVLGLSVVHATGATMLLGVIVPLVLGSHLSSRVVMHYGASSRRRR